MRSLLNVHPILHSLFVFLLSLLVMLVFSCQSYPAGRNISDIPSGEIPPIPDIYRCYSMCEAVWSERTSWRSSGWELDYFGHPQTNTMGLAIVDNNTLHLVFRGTEAPKNKIDNDINWQYSLKPIFFQENPQFKAHKGMQDKYKGVYQDVHERIKSFNGSQIILIGHSAGGMIAMLAYLDLTRSYPDKQFSAVTFGTPRIFNRAAARELNDEKRKIFRFVTEKDFFPILPPALFGYRHTGTLIRLGEASLKPYSRDAHYPGYQVELFKLLRESGTDPDSLGY
ncbi:MAG: lipase family protein [Bacteroidetes bacterium]|nr:lipase family protein [Bacteroidota bacterium]